jgi:signal transduction histidine kinase
VTDELGARAVVAAPVEVQGQLWGILAAISPDAPLPVGTEGRLTNFAEIAVTALSIAQTRGELQRLADEQAALLRVAELVAQGVRERELFQVVAKEAAGLMDNEATTLVRYDGDRTFTVLAACGGPAEVGTVFSVPADDVGTLSEMMLTGRSARVDSHAESPGRSSTPGHGQVGSSVSVPIVVEDELWGSIGTLTKGRRLPMDTEGRLQKFGELVAAAIANSQARTQVVQLADEQSALRRVAELVARGASLQEVFTGVATEASRLLSVGAALLRFDPDGYAEIVGAHNGRAHLGLRIPTTDTHIGKMFAAGQAGRLADYEEVGFADAVRDLGLQPGTAVPIIVEGKIWGALKTSPSGAVLRPEAERNVVSRVADKLEKFAALASAAIANAENRAQLTASRARIVATADDARRRLQRDVHDGAQQRLVQTVLILKLARDAADAGGPTSDLIAEALAYAERATAELRDLVHGILPASLTRGGLRSGIESLIADLPMSVQLDFAAPRLPANTEITAYFVVAEALTNVVKHAGATRAEVAVRFDPGRVTIEVRDNGTGGANPARGSGLTGLMDRVATAEGELTIDSPRGEGTVLRASLPVVAL